jgi:hypothetical protein
MKNLISCCGLNCETCDARIATINNDDAMRAATAEKWMKQYNVPHIDPASVNCTGCRIEGTKIGHWNECKIRLCASDKGYQTCGECGQMSSCELVSPVFKFLPEAVDNLKSLN